MVDAVASAPDSVRRYFKGYLIGLSFDEIAARIPSGVDFIGISVVFTHEWPAVVCLIDAIKRRHPDVPVILGGEHVSSMTEFCLLTSVADVLVLGEGEETVIELLHALRDKQPLDEIDGIAYRSGDDVVVNPRRQRTTEIDDIAWPAWHLFALDTYHEHRWMGGLYSSTKSVPILATRGCPYQCTYCSAPNMWTPRWIPRDPAKVVDEIQYYVEHFGARNFPFQDLTAIIRREWIVDFCNQLLDRDLQITWQMPTGTRTEAIDAEVAQLLRRTGLISMAYAPESGSEETRRLIKKKMKTDRLFQSMRATVAEGLHASVFLVIGFPHDTEDHLRENLPFLDAIADIGITDVGVVFLHGAARDADVRQSVRQRKDRHQPEVLPPHLGRHHAVVDIDLQRAPLQSGAHGMEVPAVPALLPAPSGCGGIAGPGFFVVGFADPPTGERWRRDEVPDSVPLRRRHRHRDGQVQAEAWLDVTG